MSLSDIMSVTLLFWFRFTIVAIDNVTGLMDGLVAVVLFFRVIISNDSFVPVCMPLLDLYKQ